MRITKLLIITAVIVLLGIGLGYYYSKLPEHNPEKNKVTCEEAHGEWIEDTATCLLSNKGAGEFCIDGAQCQSGVCFPPTLTSEQQVALSGEAVTGIIGTCYPEELIEGCVKQVNNGTVSLRSLCL